LARERQKLNNLKPGNWGRFILGEEGKIFHLTEGYGDFTSVGGRGENTYSQHPKFFARFIAYSKKANFKGKQTYTVYDNLLSQG